MQNDESLVVPFFKSVAVEIPAESKKAGRPIYRDEEQVEIRIAGERNYAPTFPAHAVWKRVNGEEITYAQRFADAYERFAANKEQVADGTPLSELPFLTEAKRATLRSLKVYTAEALATLDGKRLSALGPDARDMKNSAEAYLENARGAADVGALKAEIEELRAKLDAPTGSGDSEKESLKAQIAELTGQRPRGNPSVETLRETLEELKAGV